MAAALATLGLYLAFAVFGVHALFYDEEVNEDFPADPVSGGAVAVSCGDATDDEAVLENGFLNVGRLKGNRGDQTYALPRNFDPEEHRAISVWCRGSPSTSPRRRCAGEGPL